MNYLRVPAAKWEKFQAFKDGRPIKWVKLWLSLLDDFDFMNLSDASRSHIVLLWIVAARTNQKIPDDKRWLKATLHTNQVPNIETFISLGFLERYDDENDGVQNSTEPYETVHRIEEKREEEKRGEERIKDAPSASLLKTEWNKMATTCGVHKCMVMSDNRKRAVRARGTNQDWCRDWHNALWMVPSSPFLTGKNDRNWTADIDWFLRPDTVLKVIEGKYTDTKRERAQAALAREDREMKAQRAEVNRKPTPEEQAKIDRIHLQLDALEKVIPGKGQTMKRVMLVNESEPTRVADVLKQMGIPKDKIDETLVAWDDKQVDAVPPADEEGA